LRADSDDEVKMSERPHRSLKLWQKAVEFVVQVYQATARFPPSERFGLAGQMRRAAVSVASNIAEGAARRTQKEYAQFLYTARGSTSELDTQLEIARRLGYLKAESFQTLTGMLDEIGRMLAGLIAYASR
jgi:four helix bundle protein